ncbi:MAG: 16S rRNA (cytosine(967)-C(5))-methyltransferase RsmB [Anaerovoracaceae bacterium]|jgi:16S rRNA (cytosine967-C5)-methyltransferase
MDKKKDKKMDRNRVAAYLALLDVETKHAYSNIALNNHIGRIHPESPAFVRELTYGVLENKIYLDYVLQQFISTPIKGLKASDLVVLRMGIYQLRFMDSVPEYAAVNESVNLAKRYCRGREGFVNGVLRSFIREGKRVELPDKEKDQMDYLSIKYSYAPWIVGLWLNEYPFDFVEDLLMAGNKTTDLVIRVNTLKISRNRLKEKILGKGYAVKEGIYCDKALHVKGSNLLVERFYQEGQFSVQDESSMIAVSTLDPQPGEFIIDVCAAPGGKTFAMAEMMDNKGEILAWDIYKRKLAILQKESERLGVDIVRVKTWDATRVDSSLIEKADRVLVDAPCSGLGVVRRKPEIKYKRLTSELKNLPKKQLAILSAAAKYVKPGGTLLYSTCTINPHENTEVVKEFLYKNPHFSEEESIQLFPNINNTDGFFICKMKKADDFIKTKI